MSVRICMSCYRDLDDMGASGCDCHEEPAPAPPLDTAELPFRIVEPDVPRQGPIDIDDCNYEAAKARRYEREQQLAERSRGW